MNFEVLKEFCEFAKYLNFTRAAKALHISQSGLSRHISELERELGVNLVLRDTKILLTPAGERFLVTASSILDQYHKAVIECELIQKDKTGRLTSLEGMFIDNAYKLLLEAGRNLTKQYPAIRLHLINDPTVCFLDAVVKGIVDFGLYHACDNISGLKKENRNIVYLPILTEQLSLWVDRNSPLIAESNLSWRDLQGIPIALIGNSRRHVVWRDSLTKLSLQHGFQPVFHTKAVGNFTEFLMGISSDEVFTLSPLQALDSRIIVRTDRVAISFSEPVPVHTVYYMYREDNENPALPLYSKQLSLLLNPRDIQQHVT